MPHKTACWHTMKTTKGRDMISAALLETTHEILHNPTFVRLSGRAIRLQTCFNYTCSIIQKSQIVWTIISLWTGSFAH